MVDTGREGFKMTKYYSELDVSQFVSEAVAGWPFSLETPIQELNCSQGGVWIKRDDELSFGSSGSKIRKYASLIPRIKREGVKGVIIEGGLNANNSLAAAQLFRQNQIPFRLMVPEGSRPRTAGNQLWLKLLVAEDEMIFMADDNFEDQVSAFKALMSESVLELPEGANHSWALGGALSLAFDLGRNREHIDKPISQVIVDAGTGLMAQALILGCGSWQQPPLVRVIGMAGTKNDFEQGLLRRCHELERELAEQLLLGDKKIKVAPWEWELPATAKSFGSTNRRVFDEIARFARQEGILLDPLYSGKMVYTYQQKAQDWDTSGETILIHSGGALTLSGFQEQLVGSIN